MGDAWDEAAKKYKAGQNQGRVQPNTQNLLQNYNPFVDRTANDPWNEQLKAAYPEQYAQQRGKEGLSLLTDAFRSGLGVDIPNTPTNAEEFKDAVVSDRLKSMNNPPNRLVFEGSSAMLGGAVGGPLGAGLGYAISKRMVDSREGQPVPSDPWERGKSFAKDAAMGAAVDKVGRMVKPVYEFGKGLFQKPAGEVVETYLSRAIRPAFGNQVSWGFVQQYAKRATDAVSDIVKNKATLSFVDESGRMTSGKLPSTVREMLQAVDQGKKRIWDQYNTMAQEAGQMGAQVNLQPVVRELEALALDPVAITEGGGAVAKAAAEAADLYKAMGTYSAEQAQQAISMIDKALEPMYKSGDPAIAGKIVVEKLKVGMLREALDREITNLVGEQYQPLKNMYASYKHIEKDIAHRLVNMSRQAPQGVADLSNIASAGQAAAAISQQNASKGWVAGSMMYAKHLWKLKNDPNRMVRLMFGGVEGALNANTPLAQGGAAAGAAGIAAGEATGVGGMGKPATYGEGEYKQGEKRPIPKPGQESFRRGAIPSPQDPTQVPTGNATMGAAGEKVVATPTTTMGMGKTATTQEGEKEEGKWEKAAGDWVNRNVGPWASPDGIASNKVDLDLFEEAPDFDVAPYPFEVSEKDLQRVNRGEHLPQMPKSALLEDLNKWDSEEGFDAKQREFTVKVADTLAKVVLEPQAFGYKDHLEMVHDQLFRPDSGLNRVSEWVMKYLTPPGQMWESSKNLWERGLPKSFEGVADSIMDMVNMAPPGAVEAGLAKAVAGGKILPWAMVAYHGSGAEGIRKFDYKFLGSGEGAQYFGHGFYFTDVWGVADQYRRTAMSRRNAKVRFPQIPRYKSGKLLWSDASRAGYTLKADTSGAGKVDWPGIAAVGIPRGSDDSRVYATLKNRVRGNMGHFTKNPGGSEHWKAKLEKEVGEYGGLLKELEDAGMLKDGLYDRAIHRVIDEYNIQHGTNLSPSTLDRVARFSKPQLELMRKYPNLKWEGASPTKISDEDIGAINDVITHLRSGETVDDILSKKVVHDKKTREWLQDPENQKFAKQLKYPEIPNGARKGGWYKVDLPDQDDLLQWDKPFDKQPVKVQEALKKAGVQTDMNTLKFAGSPFNDGDLASAVIAASSATKRTGDNLYELLRHIYMEYTSNKPRYYGSKNVLEDVVSGIKEKIASGDPGMAGYGKPYWDKQFQLLDKYKHLFSEEKVGMTGEHIYNALAGGSNKKKASEYLQKLGIPGHSYPTGTLSGGTKPIWDWGGTNPPASVKSTIKDVQNILAAGKNDISTDDIIEMLKKDMYHFDDVSVEQMKMQGYVDHNIQRKIDNAISALRFLEKNKDKVKVRMPRNYVIWDTDRAKVVEEYEAHGGKKRWGVDDEQ